MEYLIVIMLAGILIETSYLVLINFGKIQTKYDDKPIFVDTSVLIDGRIVSVAESGFINGNLNIPRSVVGELQYMADQSDSEKRTKARYGLDVIAKLQSIDDLKVKIFQDGSRAEEGVDERLLKLAKRHRGSICTIDYNLNKVAKVEKIKVLNVNDLAMNFRMPYLAGDKIYIDLSQKGQEAHQAVGHLDDGTMVVVENAAKMIGKKAEIEFIRGLQTTAGKMMFAKLVDNKPHFSRINKKYTNNKRYLNKSSKRVNNNEQNVVDLINKQR